MSRNVFFLTTAGQRVVCLLALAVLAGGIFLSVRLAVADACFRENTPESVAEAARLDSGNAAYHDLLAEHLEDLGKDPESERAAAARLSPTEARYWIALAVDAEVKQDYPGAERNLLEATKISRQFDPRWALMNFYFRRGRMSDFWIWARRALEMGYDDQTPLFRLCWLATGDAGQIESILPPGRQDIQARYLGYLLATERFAAAPPVARNVAREARPEDLPLLLQYCDAAIDKDTQAALDIWNTLCRRKLESCNVLNPQTGPVVTNANFRTDPVQHGFDWRIPRVDGVFITTRGGSGGLSFEMSGDEPESMVLLTQFMPVAPGREYRLDYEYMGPEAPEDSGLTWEAGAPGSNAVLARSAQLATTGDWKTGHLNFNAGLNNAVRLELRYKRALGTVRHKGTIVLRRADAEIAR